MSFTARIHVERSVPIELSCVEIRIPVPWGHIAGKWWGPTDQRPILTLHGWQDNCGSFDLLIPLLPRNLSYLAIDSIGHGLSSKLPPGMFYHSLIDVITIQRIKEFFKWDKVSLMGHSKGGHVAYVYGILFPSAVDFMVCIEGFLSLKYMKTFQRYVDGVEDFLKYDRHNSSEIEPPSYTMEELRRRFSAGWRSAVTPDKMRYILERTVKESKIHPGKYYISRDLRVKVGNISIWTAEESLEAARRVSFPIFISKAERSMFFTQSVRVLEILEILKESSPGFEFHEVSEAHHGHLTHPEIYKDIIPNFLNKFATEDRTQSPMINQIRAKL